MNKNPSDSNLFIKNVNRPFLAPLFLLFVSGALIWRLFSFISRYAVNILFWDQWGFYTPLFHYQSLWQVFSWQHGPHRQGIGLVVTALLANMTNWNSRADAFAVGVLLCLALLCALVLKWRLFGSLTFIDVIIPLIFLTLFQYETFVVVPNLSYGVFPVLLIMLYCLGLLLENHRIRYAIILGLNFLLIYTGFGVFMGPLTMLLLSIDIYQNRHQKKTVILPILAFILALASNLSFLISYRFDPAIPNFSFSISYLPQYPLFICLMLAAFWGWHSLILGQLTATVAGAAILATITAVLIFHGQRLVRRGVYSNRVSLVATVMVSYSLLFCLTTAIGRMPLGLHYAQVSRYLTLMIPAYLALYFHLLTIRVVKLRQFALLAYLAMSIVGSLPIGIVDSLALKVYNDKVNWKVCYLQLEDVARCNQLTHFQIFPDNDALQNKLVYLKEQHLNLFLDAAK
jgi:hypothetical protein